MDGFSANAQTVHDNVPPDATSYPAQIGGETGNNKNLTGGPSIVAPKMINPYAAVHSLQKGSDEDDVKTRGLTSDAQMVSHNSIPSAATDHYLQKISNKDDKKHELSAYVNTVAHGSVSADIQTIAHTSVPPAATVYSRYKGIKEDEDRNRGLSADAQTVANDSVLPGETGHHVEISGKAVDNSESVITEGASKASFEMVNSSQNISNEDDDKTLGLFADAPAAALDSISLATTVHSSQNISDEDDDKKRGLSADAQTVALGSIPPDATGHDGEMGVATVEERKIVLNEGASKATFDIVHSLQIGSKKDDNKTDGLSANAQTVVIDNVSPAAIDKAFNIEIPIPSGETGNNKNLTGGPSIVAPKIIDPYTAVHSLQKGSDEDDDKTSGLSVDAQTVAHDSAPPVVIVHSLQKVSNEDDDKKHGLSAYANAVAHGSVSADTQTIAHTSVPPAITGHGVDERKYVLTGGPSMATLNMGDSYVAVHSLQQGSDEDDDKKRSLSANTQVVAHVSAPPKAIGNEYSVDGMK
ncbi:hypothetical protein CHS0354_029358, partial [Potamilus streckersoni]